ncbi:PREDICTED: oxysterol-binding protein 2 isoform X7 [Cyphomyrmex costatus]|uniref:oxysterol-binding protein 2 isoform X7 n=1 Tax=Cyphomyrmex costatus TaxID=456900 RepID=UPI00085242A1|nr:PREDICTED: oxysterol-binding protein 2 isoform X7 [Cyphomyrmex costatus]
MGDPKSQHGAQEMKGWLFKWTNYLKGYQRRWFVLSNGLLSYYRAEPTGGPKISSRRKRRAGRASENPAEMSHTCRGTISLHGALIHTVDACTFVVSNGGTQTFHIKASTEVERQQWVTALELAKAKAIQAMESDPAITTSPSEDEEDNAEFYDAQESDTFTLTIPIATSNSISHARDRTDSQGSDDGSSSEGDPTPLPVSDSTGANSFLIVTDSTAAQTLSAVRIINDLDITSWRSNNDSNSTGMTTISKRKRRTRVPDKPNYPLNLWSIMKNCIGKDLSKIPMPVNFSEPLSMLQRLTEDYEYADILDRAAECTDSYEQMAFVAAFTVSSYATTAARTGKPFNPLLGETYECDRTDDLGWRAISEQVSHHPPMLAQHCEGKKWRCWQEFTMASKFRGKYLQVIPLGTAHLEFNSGQQHYTWRKVTTTVHNIIVGRLWVDQSGDMDIVNHKEGIKCHLKYIPYSYFSRDSQRKVKGVVMNSNKEVKWVVQGTWDSKIEIAPVISTSGTPDNPVYKTGPYILAWKRRMPTEDSEKYYSFTELACQLNEPEEGIAPTDSRLRPDQRLMEDGRWDEANAEKLRLEEKQRAARRTREHDSEKAAAQGLSYETYEPLWFRKKQDPYTDSRCYVYNGEYWDHKNKGDWSRCPNIF